jgi:hypothetical protein
MTRIVLVAAASVALLALPATASAADTKRPNAAEIALNAKLKRLKAANARLVARNQVLSIDNKTLGQRWNEALARGEALKQHIRSVDPCPITRPNNSQPPGSTFGSVFHGNGQLWVGLSTTNVLSWQREADGSVEMKFGWWREAKGKLQISGRRLDASAPPLRARIPDGYGDAGFQSTAITFPTDGFWEVTGSVGSASLTFVTLVIGAPQP